MKLMDLLKEGTVGNNYVYEIATPFPRSILSKALKNLGIPHLTNWNSPDGLESVLALNLSKSDLKKIESHEDLGDLLVYRYDINGKKSWSGR